MRLYYGSYGHNPSPTGKKYMYYGGDNYRVGENVVAPVEHYKSGKIYNTMFTITDSRGANSEDAMIDTSRIEDTGIVIKSIGGRDVLSLPSGSQYTSKRQWEDASFKRYVAEQRLIGRETQTNTTQASQRLLNRGI